MRGKVMFVIGAGVGYVLGARAGRERYDELKSQAESVIHDPRVQGTVSQAEQNLKDKASDVADTVKQKAPVVKEKVSDAAETVQNKATDAADTAKDKASEVKDKASDAASTAKHRANNGDETRDNLIGEEPSSDYSSHNVHYTSGDNQN